MSFSVSAISVTSSQEAEQIATALQDGRGQLQSKAARDVPETAPLKEDLASLLELGTLVHDFQACSARLKQLRTNLPLRGANDSSSEPLQRLRSFLTAQEAVATALEKEAWQLAFRRFEDGAVKMVEIARQQAVVQAQQDPE